MQSHLAFGGFLGKRVHLGVTGSVAAFRALDLLRQLVRTGAAVDATLTRAARAFVAPLSFRALGAGRVYTEMFSEDPDKSVGDTELYGHLAPGQTADVMVVAPATANILAKLACGLADDMLSCQALAFPGPLVLAPAMNQRLWSAQATRENWAKLGARGAVCIEPEIGDMACGETGRGRFPILEKIFLAVLRAISPQDLAGKKVLVTLGPTREPWDAVRFLSNPSTGAMGGSVAVAAWLRGAEVTVVQGPVSLFLPGGGPEAGIPDPMRVVAVKTASQMHQACLDLWPSMDAAVLTAAVSDFSPEPFDGEGTRKFKKDQAPAEGLTLRLLPNPDILKDLGQSKRSDQLLTGFAAETSDLAGNARAKLARKNLDLIVANRVDLPGGGFGTDTNTVHVLDRTGREESWPQLPKTEVAWRIWDALSEL